MRFQYALKVAILFLAYAASGWAHDLPPEQVARRDALLALRARVSALMAKSREVARRDQEPRKTAVLDTSGLIRAGQHRELPFHRRDILGLSIVPPQQNSTGGSTRLDFSEGEEEWDDYRTGGPVSSEDLRERIGQEINARHGGGSNYTIGEYSGLLILSGPVSQVDTGTRAVKAWQEEQGRLVTVELHEIASQEATPDPAAWPAQATLSAEETQALLDRVRGDGGPLRLVRTVTLSALSGQKAVFFDGVRHSFLGDINRSANSAGAGGVVDVVAVADPVVSECASGLLLKLRGQVSGDDSGLTRLDIAYSTCRFDGLETVDTVGGKIETPRLTVSPLRVHVDLLPGQAAVLTTQDVAAPDQKPERRLFLLQLISSR